MYTLLTTHPDPVDWAAIEAVLFDLDGVLTPTAILHEAAWAELFADHGFTAADYRDAVDGKPRVDGVRSFLATRGIDAPEGTPQDGPELDTVHGLASRKNLLFHELLERQGVEPYPDAVELLDELQRRQVPMAVVSSSNNAVEVLRRSGLFDRFETIVDGLVRTEMGLGGKPRPDTFLHAAELMGVRPASTAVLEDATSGVRAAVLGAFAPVIGVSRNDEASELEAAGADVVVDDLAMLVAR